MSIYSHVFGYRPRSDRLPIEDFLTAALADLLNRLPFNEHLVFIGGVLLRGDPGQAWARWIGKQQPELRWDIQRGVVDGSRKGIADLVLLVDGRDALVMENKVAAEVRGHGASVPESALPAATDVADREEYTQLTTYGRWLEAQCVGQPWPGALVFLTHLTQPPADFSTQVYGVPYVSVCRWHDIWRWAAGMANRLGGTAADRPAWIQLAAELATFLEELNMTGSGLTTEDAASIGGFIDFKGRADRTFAVVAGHISSAFGELGSSRISAVTSTNSMSCVWSWFYLKPRNTGWYIGWGIRTQGRTTHWSELDTLPSGPHAFLMLGTDGQAIPVASLSDELLPPGWQKLRREVVVTKVLQAFPSDGDGFSEAFARWVATELNAFRKTIAILQNQSPGITHKPL